MRDAWAWVKSLYQPRQIVKTGTTGRPRRVGKAAAISQICRFEAMENRRLFTSVTFTLDSTHSSLDLSGLVLTQYPISEQGTGGLTTSYTGTITADLTGSSLTFKSASIAANNNGSWEAAGGGALANTAAPANYGAAATAVGIATAFAYRNLNLNLASAGATTVGSNGSFALSGETFSLTTGETDGGAPKLGNSSTAYPLAGGSGPNAATATGSLVTSNGTSTLTLPVDLTMVIPSGGVNFTVELTGTLTASSKGGSTGGTGTISGIAWKDTNGNGALDAGEPRFPGVQVYLDMNKDGTFDAGDVAQISDANGQYSFTNLAAGTYQLRETLPAGYKITHAPAVGFYTLALAAGQSISASFGNAPVSTGDTTPPTSSVAPLPATETTLSFTVSWSGTDNAGGSGLANYDIYYNDNGGALKLFENHTTATSAVFTGVNGHRYAFFSRARDNAGNLEAAPATADARTTINVNTTADTTPPTSSVAPLPATEPTSFTLNWSGTDNPGGSGIANYDIYYNDNGGAVKLLLSATSATSFQFTGVSGHRYAFFSRARDKAGNLEAAPSTADAVTTVH
jgi:hypothetical protein